MSSRSAGSEVATKSDDFTHNYVVRERVLSLFSHAYLFTNLYITYSTIAIATVRGAATTSRASLVAIGTFLRLLDELSLHRDQHRGQVRGPGMQLQCFANCFDGLLRFVCKNVKIKWTYAYQKPIY